MKISTRLSITSSLIASSIFLIFGITIYLFSSEYRKVDFQERLIKRVEITEKLFLEKESFTALELEKISDQFLHTLPSETEEVVEIIKTRKVQFEHEYPVDVESFLANDEHVLFEANKRQGASRFFHVSGKDYLIVVTATDVVGLQNLSFLKNVILLLILIGIPLIFIGSFFITHRALLPLSKTIAKANTISASNLNQRLTVLNPNDEIGQLGIAFNKLLDRLEEAFETQKSFIRNASHEIKNPLTAIMGEADLALSKSRTNEEYLASMNTILIESEVLNSTVSNLLQLSKVSVNEEQISFEKIDVDVFIKALIESYGFVNPENKVVLEGFVESGNESNLISGNKSLLKTALVNLIDNACKFSENKQVDMSVRKVGNDIIVSVRDKGIGIRQEDISKVVLPFYRGDNTVQIKGSGIGLALSKKIIDLHYGSLIVESELNKGTVVIVKIPMILS